jgi:serine/threonine protein kinase
MRLEDHFDILKPLGAGGCGHVYLVREKATGHVSAAKVLIELAGDGRQRFTREVKQLLRYRGFRHVVRVVRAYLNAERPFFLMTYAPGGSVRPWAGKLNERQVLTIMRQLMDTLTQIHADGGVHRDVKPDNLLLLADGTMAVADFGLGNSPRCTVLVTMNAYGTVGYIAPELMRGAAYTPACDIYSAGATWFHLVTGVYPGNLPAPLDPTTIKPATPPWVADVIRRMTSPDPAQRPTAFNVLRVLNMTLGPKDERLPGTPQPTFSNGEKLFLGALAVAGLAALLGS